MPERNVNKSAVRSDQLSSRSSTVWLGDIRCATFTEEELNTGMCGEMEESPSKQLHAVRLWEV